MGPRKAQAWSPCREVRFMVDGERIAADDTAEKLGLEERWKVVGNSAGKTMAKQGKIFGNH